MARVLIVGCGCRGQALSRALVAEGHAVRGTTRDPARTAAIAAAGAEPFVGDPDRIGTLMGAIEGATIVCWLLRTARVTALHDERLQMLCERLVDTPVRGLVYEAGAGREIVLRAADTWRIPVRLVETDPALHHHWLDEAVTAVQHLLAP